jgi:hypothetical protein
MAMALDWLNPETWKQSATLLDYWKTIAGGAVVIFGALGSLTKWGRSAVRWLWSKRRRTPAAPAERPLRFVSDDHQSIWAEAREGTQKNAQVGTQVSGHWHVSNVSDRDFVILKARLHGFEAKFAHVVTRGPKNNTFGSKHPVRAHTMSEVAATLMFFPAICDGHEPLIADVIFVDNYGDEHIVPSVRFKHVGP